MFCAISDPSMRGVNFIWPSESFQVFFQKRVIGINSKFTQYRRSSTFPVKKHIHVRKFITDITCIKVLTQVEHCCTSRYCNTAPFCLRVYDKLVQPIALLSCTQSCRILLHIEGNGWKYHGLGLRSFERSKFVQRYHIQKCWSCEQNPMECSGISEKPMWHDIRIYSWF